MVGEERADGGDDYVAVDAGRDKEEDGAVVVVFDPDVLEVGGDFTEDGGVEDAQAGDPVLVEAEGGAADDDALLVEEVLIKMLHTTGVSRLDVGGGASGGLAGDVGGCWRACRGGAVAVQRTAGSWCSGLGMAFGVGSGGVGRWCSVGVGVTGGLSWVSCGVASLMIIKQKSLLHNCKG